MNFGTQEKPRGSADGSADQVHGSCPDYLLCYPLESLNILEFLGGLFGESGESNGFLFKKNAHTEFPFNSRRVQSSEAHDEELFRSEKGKSGLGGISNSQTFLPCGPIEFQTLLTAQGWEEAWTLISRYSAFVFQSL